jgi:hypothetical protein
MAAVVQKRSRQVIRTLRYLGYLEAGINDAVVRGDDPLLDNEPALARTMAASVPQREQGGTGWTDAGGGKGRLHFLYSHRSPSPLLKHYRISFLLPIRFSQKRHSRAPYITPSL